MKFFAVLFGAVLAAQPLAAAAAGFTLTSASVADGATLPSTYASGLADCGGKNVSPAMQWSGAPAGTQSFAVALFDPDGAKGLGVVHWLAYGIPANTTSLAEGAGSAPATTLTGGTNTRGRTSYLGPCPPAGDVPHHYLLSVYALDLPPDSLAAGLTRDAFLAAIHGHSLGEASLVARFGR